MNEYSEFADNFIWTFLRLLSYVWIYNVFIFFFVVWD